MAEKEHEILNVSKTNRKIVNSKHETREWENNPNCGTKQLERKYRLFIAACP